jgi:CheY-like chemotaxis protein
MKPPLRILHLEDNPTDAELIQGILETEGIICAVTRVDTQADFFASIERGGFDLILTDYTLPVLRRPFCIENRPGKMSRCAFHLCFWNAGRRSGD